MKGSKETMRAWGAHAPIPLKIGTELVLLVKLDIKNLKLRGMTFAIILLVFSSKFLIPNVMVTK